MSFVEADWQGRPVIVCRTGYTGERGYELVPRWEDTPALWDALTEAAAAYDGLPCGLGARDTLRTEMGYPLHGHDLVARHHAGPGPRRLGRRLEEAGVLGPGGAGRREGGRCAPHLLGAARHRSRHPARALPGEGRPRRGGRARSPPARSRRRCKQGIALALLDRGAAVGDEVVVDVRGREVAATVVKPPFVQVQTRQG